MRDDPDSLLFDANSLGRIGQTFTKPREPWSGLTLGRLGKPPGPPAGSPGLTLKTLGQAPLWPASHPDGSVPPIPIYPWTASPAEPARPFSASAARSPFRPQQQDAAPGRLQVGDLWTDPETGEQARIVAPSLNRRPGEYTLADVESRMASLSSGSPRLPDTGSLGETRLEPYDAAASAAAARSDGFVRNVLAHTRPEDLALTIGTLGAQRAQDRTALGTAGREAMNTFGLGLPRLATSAWSSTPLAYEHEIEKAADAAGRAAHPRAAEAGQMAGLLGQMAVLPAGAAATPVRAAATGALLGGGQAAVDTLGDAQETLKAAAMGAALGFSGGTVLGAWPGPSRFPFAENAPVREELGSFAADDLSAAQPAGSGGSLARRGENNVASRGVYIYDPPVKPARPFELDYPGGAHGQGAVGDGPGRLAVDIDGRPLGAKTVVGRRVVGGDDEAFPPSEFNALGKATTGSGIAMAPQSALGSKVGYTSVSRSSGWPTQVVVSQDLPPEIGQRVTAHEIGHVLDPIASEIATAGLKKELGATYNDLNNPQSYGKRWGQEQNRYTGGDITRELVAEATGACVTDPVGD